MERIPQLKSNGATSDGAGSNGEGSDGGSSAAKLSFGGGWKGQPKKARLPASAKPADEEKQREAITGFNAGSALTANGKPAPAGKRVIQKQEDSFKVGVGKKPKKELFLPDHDDGTVGTVEDKFEAAPEAAQENFTYGLNLQPKRDRSDNAAASGQQNVQPNGQLNGQPAAGGSVNSREWETRQFKQDVEALPDEADAAAYEAMPVEEFGAAMLRGMGWTEGGSVGRRQAGPAQPFQYVQRPHRLGLGAQPAKQEEKPKRHIKPGETREPKADKVFIDAEGRQRHVMGINDKLVDRKLLGVHPGKTMYLLSGRHEGLACRVLALEPKVEGRSDKAVVELQPSAQAVTVRCDEMGEKHEADALRNDKKAAKEARRRGKEAARSSGDDRGGKRRRDDAGGAHRDEESQNQRKRDSAAARDLSSAPEAAATHEPGWLATHIRVRIIDKKLAQGRLYLKKATIVDVHQPTVCDVVVDDPKQRATALSQRQLETVVPKAEGSRVLLLAGAHKGQIAKLLSRNGKAGAAAVQLTSDYQVVKVAFDDIAEYVGDAHEEE